MSKNVAGKFFNVVVAIVVVVAVVGLWDVADAKALPSEGNPDVLYEIAATLIQLGKDALEN